MGEEKNSLADDKAPSPFIPLPPGERGRGEGSLHIGWGEGAFCMPRCFAAILSEIILRDIPAFG